VADGSDGAHVIIRRLSDLPDEPSGAESKIALTFDDGPHPQWTNDMLDALAAHRAPATFFVLGDLATQYPHLVERMVRDGHTVGNHSWSHSGPSAADDADAQQEVLRTDELLRELTGAPVRYFRPPYRKTDASRYATLLADRDIVTVTWSVDPRDWRGGDAETISDAVLGALHPGAIVLLHDGGGRDRTETVRAVPMIVSGARALGYELVAM